MKLVHSSISLELHGIEGHCIHVQKSLQFGPRHHKFFNDFHCTLQFVLHFCHLECNCIKPRLLSVCWLSRWVAGRVFAVAGTRFRKKQNQRATNSLQISRSVFPQPKQSVDNCKEKHNNHYCKKQHWSNGQMQFRVVNTALTMILFRSTFIYFPIEYRLVKILISFWADLPWKQNK